MIITNIIKQYYSIFTDINIHCCFSYWTEDSGMTGAAGDGARPDFGWHSCLWTLCALVAQCMF